MDSDLGGEYVRRLPIYLLIGTSSSMAGAPIQAVSQGVSLLCNDLMNDASAIETVHLAVITFDTQARLVTPLTEITQFSPPTLHAGGEAHAMGAALRLLNELLDRDIRPDMPGQKGDYKTLVFLMTDSPPTDDWESAAEAIKNRATQKAATIIALGCGGGVDQSILQRITEVVLMMDTLTPDQISQFFQWVSQSVNVASKMPGDEEDAEIPLPVLPPHLKDIPITPQVETEANTIVCTLADGTTIECEAHPFAETSDSELYWDKAGSHIVSLFKHSEPHLERLIEQLLTPEYDVTRDDPYWDELFAWPKAIIQKPRLGLTMLREPKGTMELRWFLGGKRRRAIAAKHGPEKLGKWTNHFSVAIKMARVVRRMHSHKLSHSDLSFHSFLVDPSQNRIFFVGWRDIIVPGIPPHSTLGTSLTMAPELSTQLNSPGINVEPSVQTDLHSLAVLIYWLLLQRHPLLGSKEHSNDPALDEALALGERALFVEHPTDTSNKPENLPLPYTSVFTPAVQRLVERAFVEGLHDPAKRPAAAQWERDLVRMADALVPCANPSCPLQAFVLPASGRAQCPACGTVLDSPNLVPLLHFYCPVAGKRGEFRNDDGYILVGWPGRTLHIWHLEADRLPGPGVDTSPKAHLEYDPATRRWSLVNEAIAGLRILGEAGQHQQVPTGSSCELVNEMQLLLGEGDDARLAYLQLANLS